VILLSLVLAFVVADDSGATRSPWSYIRGPSGFTLAPTPYPNTHGDASEFSVAVIPDATNPDIWTPCGEDDYFCTSGDNIGIETYSRLSNCWVQLDFSYFLTIVYVPEDFVITTFTIDFEIMDDGAQIYIQNSDYPEPTVVPGSLVTLGGSLSFAFADEDYLVAGEDNYIIIVQVDDCATQNNIIATVALNGQTVVVDTCPEGEPCDDGIACTDDDTCTGGVCIGEPVVCTAEDQCYFAGTCDEDTGVCSTPTKPDRSPCEDGNACTVNDTCKAGVCTSGAYMCCHGAKGCGFCVKDCKVYYEQVLDAFQLPSGTDCDIMAAGAGKTFCSNSQECCVPKYQTTCYYSSSNNVCSIPVPILPPQ